MKGWTRLTQRCRFLLTGADRVRYLNGQVTNQVDHLVDGESRYAVITNHKGQLEGDLHIASQVQPDGLYLDADAALQESLHTRLDRYIIADDVELSDITEAWRGLHLLGVEADSLASLPSDVQVIRTNRFGTVGLDLWCPASMEDGLILDALTELRLEELDERTLEWHRMARGIPKWGHELTPGLLPPEARIESRAIDYRKGCYIGQEVISRIKSVGKVNRRLVLLALEPDSAQQPEPGDSLWLPDAAEDARAQGVLTSLASHPDVQAHPREVLALGYLKSQHAIEGTHVIAGKSPSAASAKFTVLPFPDPS